MPILNGNNPWKIKKTALAGGEWVKAPLASQRNAGSPARAVHYRIKMSQEFQIKPMIGSKLIIERASQKLAGILFTVDKGDIGCPQN